jgi:hypothetical protein
MMRRVLVTHVESAVGRRVVKALFHDPEVALVLALGTESEPTYLAPYRGKVAYQRLDLAKARHLQSFLHSERFARARPDSVIHLPFAGDAPGERVPGGVPSLVSETRRLVEECVEKPAIERFVYLSSVFVYDPEPGNGNVVSGAAARLRRRGRRAVRVDRRGPRLSGRAARLGPAHDDPARGHDRDRGGRVPELAAARAPRPGVATTRCSRWSRPRRRARSCWRSTPTGRASTTSPATKCSALAALRGRAAPGRDSLPSPLGEALAFAERMFARSAAPGLAFDRYGSCRRRGSPRRRSASSRSTGSRCAATAERRIDTVRCR